MFQRTYGDAWTLPNLPYRKAHIRYAVARLVDGLTHPGRGRADWVPADNVFFVVGHGRSGTQFLADLLDRAANATVAHEPCVADIYAAQRGRVEPAFADAYVRDYRRHRIQAWAAAARPRRYGEVNSRLRHFIEPLRRSFPEAPILRLVRDGRDVVRSMLARDRWMIDVLVARASQLHIDDPFVEELAEMDDFARACWYWRYDTLRLAAKIPTFVRFEEFVRDPDYVMANIVVPLGLDLEPAVVQREIKAPKNSTQQHVVGGWNDWATTQRATFWRLCGDVMEQHGYAA
ncbi:MAG: sulfotransferase [Pseudomonadota bacterium]